MKILLLGASSYLGARLFFDMDNQFDMVGTFSSHAISAKFLHLDITKHSEVVRLVTTVTPDVIIHVANNANPKWCEANPEEAVRVNQTSMVSVIDAASTVRAKIIYISSFSAEDESTVYGRTKHAAEQLIKNSGLEYVILRPSLILGVSPNNTNDRSFNRILKNLDANIPVEYDTSWKFQATYIRHLSEVIQKSIRTNIYGKTIPVAVSKITSRYDVVKDILGPFGIAVTPIDVNDRGALLTEDLTILHDLGLPEYSYEDMIQCIIKEIKQRKLYTL